VRRCLITGNNIGIIVSGGARPIVQANNIFENKLSNVEVRAFDQEPVKLDFSRNWWGETALGIIEERIQDGSDDPSLKAFILLEPVLTEAVILQTESPAKP
jgi:parallel beta-helix repeat protein